MPDHFPRELWNNEAGRMVRCLCSCGFRAFIGGFPNEDLLDAHLEAVGC